MTTNTNPSRKPAARFFVPDTRPAGATGWPVMDREGNDLVIRVSGRQMARTIAGELNQRNPEPQGPRPVDEPKAEAKRTSHADCEHASSKLARAICRRDRVKADATN